MPECGWRASSLKLKHYLITRPLVMLVGYAIYLKKEWGIRKVHCNPNLESEEGLPREVLTWCLRSGAVLLAVAAFSTEALAATAIPYRAAPSISPDAVDRSDGPHVFNTVAIPIRAQPTSTRWKKIMRASLDQPALVNLTADARELSPVEQAAYIQSKMSYAIHRVSFSSYNCSDDGYWAAASETLVRGRGDCIDIAIAKMEALRLLGIPKEDLYLTTGYVTGGGRQGDKRESAALLVRIGNNFWLLPEQSERVIKADSEKAAYSNFTPILTYGVAKTWVHGRLVKTASLGN
jgi:predicted transglutaminase-like cysteine proteinase